MPYPGKAHRRQQCEAVFNFFGMAQRHVARYVTDNLVLSATTPAKPPFVRRSARPASRPVRSVTASGCVNFTPDKCHDGKAAAIRDVQRSGAGSLCHEPSTQTGLGAPHEICVGERQIAPRGLLLRDVRAIDWSDLPAGSWYETRLLRPELLRGPLPECGSGSCK